MLGIVTEATLRLLPFPPARGSISSSFSSIEDAATAVRNLVRLYAFRVGDCGRIHPRLLADI
jgi:FAD/FMN-containing dehydrogenase